jgi:PPP family 3-phenylpropionic acid transporter
MRADSASRPPLLCPARDRHPMHTSLPQRLGFVPRLAALYAGIFLFSGIQLPFFPVWLKAKGIDAGMIGVIVALPMLARVIAIPFVSREADRRDALRGAIVLAAWASGLGFVLVGLSDGGVLILAAYAAASLAYAPVMPLTDAYALKGLAERGRAYGPVRLWGSAAFVAGNFAAGFAADLIAARNLIWPMACALVLVGLAAVSLVPQSAGPAPDRANASALWRDRGFLAVLAAAGLIQASHAVYYGFSALQWRGEGLAGSAIAGLWALGVIAEIVLFGVSGRLGLSPIALLLLGASGAVLRWSAMALDPPALALPFLQLLHALSFGATHLGALAYVAQRAGRGQAATAQGQLAIALSAIMAASTALSGVLYAGFGAASYAAMSLAAVAGGACALVARRRGAIALVV